MNILASLTELCDAFNAHDLDRIMSLFADDCVLEMPGAAIRLALDLRASAKSEKGWRLVSRDRTLLEVRFVPKPRRRFVPPRGTIIYNT
jgi:ketosteroid isomerase-like protein